MNEFICKFQKQISGVLSGFDRVVFRGNLAVNHETGMIGYLAANRISWSDYASHVETVSKQVKTAALEGVKESGRPVQYLRDAKQSKEQMARAIAARDGVQNGPVCAFTAVEPCFSWNIVTTRNQKLRLVRARRQCLHVYHYWIDAVLGFMSARLQTWFPFALQIFINGREWLARQMDDAGMEYIRHDNCFSWVDDFSRAQSLLDAQLKTDWKALLDSRARQIHPHFDALFANYPCSYYWTTYQSEWATDVMFHDAESLRRLYPRLLQLGILGLSPVDVLRFMGKKVSCHGKPMGRYGHQVSSGVRQANSGTRIKHRLEENSIKLYDKVYAESGAVLRAELTLNNSGRFRVYRPVGEQGPMQWQTMRAGIADLHRRSEVCQKAIDRYYTALAAVDDGTTLKEIAAAVEKRVRWNGQSVRALHPFATDDLPLLQAVNRGEFTINGLRNRDLQKLLYGSAPGNDAEARRRSAAVTRKIRMLRAHGILQKLPHTHRYQVTSQGRVMLNAILCAQHVTHQKLASLAA